MLKELVLVHRYESICLAETVLKEGVKRKNSLLPEHYFNRDLLLRSH